MPIEGVEIEDAVHFSGPVAVSLHNATAVSADIPIAVRGLTDKESGLCRLRRFALTYWSPPKNGLWEAFITGRSGFLQQGTRARLPFAPLLDVDASGNRGSTL